MSELQNLPAPCVPHKIDRAKRIAKQLSKLFPNRTLSNCQEVTAKVFGHKDWHALEQAVASGAARGPYNDDLSESQHERRLIAQFRIICKELAGIDPDSETAPPRVSRSTGPMTDEMLAQQFMKEESIRDDRERIAHNRWGIQYSLDALRVLKPTSRSSTSSDHYIPGVSSSCHEEDFKEIPARLANWWRKNISHQPEVADAIGKYKLDPEDRFSIMRFGRHWGVLCLHYAATINWTMVMGTAYLLSTQYGAIDAINSPDLPEAMSKKDQSEKVAAFDEMAHQGAIAFLQAYTRDDLAAVFEAQPDAFENAALEVMAILGDPKSEKGTWEYEDQRVSHQERMRS